MNVATENGNFSN